MAQRLAILLCVVVAGCIVLSATPAEAVCALQPVANDNYWTKCTRCIEQHTGKFKGLELTKCHWNPLTETCHHQKKATADVISFPPTRELCAISVRKFDDLATQSPHRIFSIGDIHGDLQNLVRSLRLAELIDAQGKWTSNTGDYLVMLGDYFDRGLYPFESFDLLTKLAVEAAEKNRAPRVILIQGNHELMVASAQFNYINMWSAVRDGKYTIKNNNVSPKPSSSKLVPATYKTFFPAKSNILTNEDVLLERLFGTYDILSSCKGEYFKKIAVLPPAALAGGNLFSHAEISPQIGAEGPEGNKKTLQTVIDEVRARTWKQLHTFCAQKYDSQIAPALKKKNSDIRNSLDTKVKSWVKDVKGHPEDWDPNAVQEPGFHHKSSIEWTYFDSYKDDNGDYDLLHDPKNTPVISFSWFRKMLMFGSFSDDKDPSGGCPLYKKLLSDFGVSHHITGHYCPDGYDLISSVYLNVTSFCGDDLLVAADTGISRWGSEKLVKFSKTFHTSTWPELGSPSVVVLEKPTQEADYQLSSRSCIWQDLAPIPSFPAAENHYPDPVAHGVNAKYEPRFYDVIPPETWNSGRCGVKPVLDQLGFNSIELHPSQMDEDKIKILIDQLQNFVQAPKVLAQMPSQIVSNAHEIDLTQSSDELPRTTTELHPDPQQNLDPSQKSFADKLKMFDNK